MLAELTSNTQRLLIPLDFGHTKEDEVFVSPPTGTASAMFIKNYEGIEIDSSQTWFWTDEWQAGEREVDAHIAAGEIETFDSIDDMFRALNE